MEKMHFDDHDLLRFCRARKFVLADIQEMWTNFINWRIEQGVDDIITTYSYEERWLVQEHYPHMYHKTDKMGRPIYIERIGQCDVPAVFEVTTEDRLRKHFIQEYEILIKLRLPVCSLIKGEKLQRSLTIIDMTDGGLSTANS